MEWTPARIPTEQHQQICDILKKHPELGYTGPNEFIRDAVRDKIVEVHNKQGSPKKEA